MAPHMRLRFRLFCQIHPGVGPELGKHMSMRGPFSKGLEKNNATETNPNA